MIDHYLDFLKLWGAELSADELVVYDDEGKKQSAGRVTRVGFVWTEFGQEYRQKFLLKRNGALVRVDGAEVRLAAPPEPDVPEPPAT